MQARTNQWWQGTRPVNKLQGAFIPGKPRGHGGEDYGEANLARFLRIYVELSIMLVPACRPLHIPTEED